MRDTLMQVGVSRGFNILCRLGFADGGEKSFLVVFYGNENIYVLVDFKRKGSDHGEVEMLK